MTKAINDLALDLVRELFDYRDGDLYWVDMTSPSNVWVS